MSNTNGQCINTEIQREIVKSIKHVRKLPDGVYIRGSVQGYPVLLTADTGATKTVISKRVYEAMRPEDKPKLGKSSKLIGAGGVL